MDADLRAAHDRLREAARAYAHALRARGGAHAAADGRVFIDEMDGDRRVIVIGGDHLDRREIERIRRDAREMARDARERGERIRVFTRDLHMNREQVQEIRRSALEAAREARAAAEEARRAAEEARRSVR